MKKGWISLGIAGVLLITFCVILYLVWTKKVDKIDKFVYAFISKGISLKNTKIMKFLTFFGGTVGIALGLLVSDFFIKDNFDRIFLTLGILGEVALNNLIKVVIKRFRPTINPLVIETGYSFPSGHTMSTTALYSLLLFFLWKSSIPIALKVFLSIPFIMIIFCVLISRVYLGVHYISDVTAGLCLSLSYVLVITFFYSCLRNYFI
jgi:undecaprenyl-diphosphatase